MLPDAEPCGLAHVQRELQRLITSQREDAALDARAASAIGCAGEQVAVYRGMYTLRLIREVAREFPATRALLGPARFAALARAFVAAHPSSSFTLDGYARAFPELLREASGPAAELARLERELASVRAAPSPRESRSPDAALGARGAPRLVPAPGARVLRFAYDVEGALALFERGEPMRPPRRDASRLALFRRGGRLVRMRVARREAPLLAALLGGSALEPAAGLALEAGLAPRAIGRALERFVREQLLIAV